MKVGFATPMLVVLNAVITGAVIVCTADGSQVSQLRATPARAPTIQSFSFDVPSTVTFDSLQAQAIFHKSRSFYVAPPVQEAVQPVPDFRFAGAMSFPGQPLTAMLINNQSGTRQKVHSGDVLDGWTVTEVTSRSVVVTLGERTSEIGAAAPRSSTGMTPVSRQEVAEGSNATGAVKILSGRGPSTTSVPNTPTNNGPRLYRPPAT